MVFFRSIDIDEMTSAASRLQPCSKCPKSQGHATCGGCEKWFCIKHLVEHRQELSEQLSECILERDQLQANLTADDSDRQHPLLIRIDRWEAKSIERIKQVANEVRSQLKMLVSRSERRVEEALRPLTAELEENQRNGDYTELELTRWMRRLNELKEQLEKASMLEMTYDEDEQASNTLPLIQLRTPTGVKGNKELCE